MSCPACDGGLVERGQALWCDQCHTKVETCCEGGPQPCKQWGPDEDGTAWFYDPRYAHVEGDALVAVGLAVIYRATRVVGGTTFETKN